jgi:radical SAM modification target selenobiotic family peptide
MDTSDLKKILAGIAVTSLLAGATLSVGGCRGNSS